VRKCARVGLAALATVFAPAAINVRMADVAGVRLWACAGRHAALLHADGLLSQGSEDRQTVKLIYCNDGSWPIADMSIGCAELKRTLR